MSSGLLKRALSGLLLGLAPALALAGSLTDVITETVRDLRVIERSGVCNANPFKQDQLGVPVAPACAPVVAKCPVRMIPLSSKCTKDFVAGPSIPRYGLLDGDGETLSRSANEATCTREVFTASGLVTGYASRSCTFQVSGFGETIGIRASWGWCYNGFEYQPGYDAVGTQSGAYYCVTQAQLNSATGSCQSERTTLKLACVTRPPESTMQKLQTLKGLEP